MATPAAPRDSLSEKDSGHDGSLAPHELEWVWPAQQPDTFLERSRLDHDLVSALNREPGYDHLLVWTREEEARLKRTTDVYALLPAMVVFVSLSLDRSNVANALTDNLLGDLHMTQNQLNTALTLFNIGIVIFEIPFNMIAKRVGPHVFLPSTVICWGLVTIGQAFVTNHRQLWAVRFLVGMFEAGFIPGFAFYLGRFYTRGEIALRYAIFWSANYIASILAGLLSLGILNLRGTGGLAGWSWLFIIEGLFTVVVGLFALLWFPPSAARSTSVLSRRGWYTERESAIITTRVLVDDPKKANEVKKTPVTIIDILDTLKNWRMILIILAAFSGMIQTTPVNTYTPLIIKRLGYQGYTANGLAVPGYVLGMGLAISFGFFVNRYGRQGIFAACAMAGSIASFLWISLPSNSTDRVVLYVATIFSSAFSSSFVGIFGSWVANSVESRQRPIALSLFVMANNLAGIAGSQVFRAQDAPRYQTGFLTLVGTSAAAIVITVVAHFVLWSRRLPVHRKG